MYNVVCKTMPTYDVVVVGGGIAGVAAAVAASRNGAKTLLMEKSVVLGGLATSGLISLYEPLCDGEGHQMIYGISEELIRLSIKYGFENLPAKWGGNGKHSTAHSRFTSFFSPSIFSLALLEYLEENNVNLRFDTMATYPDMEGNICKGILVETISGQEYYPAKMIIDATGDASISMRAGIPTEQGDNYLSYITHELDYEGAKKLSENGDFRAARRWKFTGSDMNGNGHPEGMGPIRVNTADDVTKYMQLGGKQVLERLKQSDKDSRDILSVPHMPQFRKIRRIIGEYEFDGQQDEENFVPDAIGICGDFRKAGKRYQLPYGILYNRCVKNLYVAGRIVSAKDDGWEITRVIPVAALTGEAAGTAAALCVKEECANDTLDVKKLQEFLRL